MTRYMKIPAATVSAFALILLACASPAQSQDVGVAQIEAVQGGVATVIQNGDRNSASVSQLALESGFVPGQNQALITQHGDDNSASIQQEGSTNAAEIAQNGANNQGTVLQMNAGNGVQLQQTGNGLSIMVEQYGTGIPGAPPVVITQGN